MLNVKRELQDVYKRQTGYLVSESVHVVFTHIVASDDYRAGVCVVETAYQVYKRCV